MTVSQMSFDVSGESSTPRQAPAISLRPYQEEALEKIKDASDRGVRRQLGVAATGLGKGLVHGTRVLNPYGHWVLIEHIVVGDYVVGANGEATEVTGVFERGVLPAFEVAFSDGTSVTVDGDHLWTVARSTGENWRTVETREMYHDGTRVRGVPKWKIPIVTPINYLSPPKLPIDPYVMGVLALSGFVADDEVGFVRASADVLEIVEKRLAKAGYVLGKTNPRVPHVHTINKGLAEILDKGGFVDNDGRINGWPHSVFMEASAESRSALLAGLLDVVGEVARDGAVVVRRFLDEIESLARSLGHIATRKGASVRIAARECPFFADSLVRAWNATPRLTVRKTITSISPRKDQETTCIKVAAEDGLFVVEGYTVTHNTIMFSALAQQSRVPTLVLAHRDELINQAVDKMLQVWPGADIGVVKAARNEVDRDVVVASIQTLARENRRNQLPVDRFGLVIVDEAHHAKAISYQTILEHLKAGQDDGPLLIGVTATPDRGDGKGLVETFDEIVFTYDMLWGIRAGYLSDLRGVRVHIDADFSKVKVSKGDYDVGQAGQMLHDANAPEQIVEAWTKYASDRKTIVFTPTVATAEEVMLEFIKVGVPVGMVSGAMPIDERRDVLARYASGDIQVIANCAVLTEGFDDPETSCIVIARPTKSRSLYTQMIGRGTRRHPHKQDCMVLDVVGASATHNLVTVPSLFGIEKEEDFEEAEKPVTVAVDEQVAEEVARGELKANEADLFRKVLESPIAWVDFNNALAQGCYMCSLGNREAGVVIIEPIPRDVAEDAGSERLYHSYTQWDNENVPSGLSALMLNTDGSAYRTLITGVNLEMAQGVAEDYVRKNGAAHLVDKDAPWRKKAPSPAQLEAARKWRMAVDPAWSCGELSDALSAHIAAKKARSKDKPKRVDNRGWSR